MAKIIAQGGFNTGRLYQADGQKVYWFQLDNGWTYFNDRSRMVDGYIQSPLSMKLDRHSAPRMIMRDYDAGNLERCNDSNFHQEAWRLIPDDFDYGPALKI